MIQNTIYTTGTYPSTYPSTYPLTYTITDNTYNVNWSNFVNPITTYINPNTTNIQWYINTPFNIYLNDVKIGQRWLYFFNGKEYIAEIENASIKTCVCVKILNSDTIMHSQGWYDLTQPGWKFLKGQEKPL